MAAREDHEFFALAPEHLERFMAIERRSFSNPWSAADFRYVIQDRRAVCLGLAWNGKMIGYAVGYLDGTDFHLANLAIDPQLRRRGWAGKLLRRVLAEARRKGCRRCTLEVREANLGALQFYRKHGFQQVAVRSGFYTQPKENARVMHRTIEKF